MEPEEVEPRTNVPEQRKQIQDSEGPESRRFKAGLTAHGTEVAVGRDGVIR